MVIEVVPEAKDVRLAVSPKLLAQLGDLCGIRTRHDVARLGGAGVDAILVGETLLRDPDPAAAAERLSGVAKVGRYRG